VKERLLAELEARIARHTNGDSSGVLDEQALALVAELTRMGDPDAGSLARVAALHLCRSEALPPEHGAVDLRLAMALYTNLHTVDPRLVPPPVRALFGLASPHEIGIALLREYERAGRPEHLERAISLFRQEVLDQPDAVNGRYILAMALLRRFERFGGLSDVDESVALFREVVAATATHPDYAPALSTLAVALRRRFEKTGQRADLDEADRLGRA
jgi:hypothetical protein